jgi:hypothetical protein
MCNPVTTKWPESLLEKGVHEGFEWEVTNNGIGYRCGYVRIPAGHPWHGKDYDSVQPYPDVHGGLTFAEADADCGKGGDDSAWWVGFDCAHAGDAADPSLPGRDNQPLDPRMVHSFSYDTIKSTSYVAAQCRALAEQAKAAAS